MACTVRPARPNDAEEISRVIVAALRGTNAQDYTDAVNRRVERSFSPEAVLELMGRRKVFVATLDGGLVGTASLDGRVVRTVFVEPGCQRRNVGRLLMARVEQAAIEEGINVLVVPSSVTAEPFYAKLGFRAVRDSFHGEERTVVMERWLTAAP